MTQTINDNLVVAGSTQTAALTVSGATQLAAPPKITTVPASAIDQNGVLNVATIGAYEVAYVDDVVQLGLDAIANRIANSPSLIYATGGATLMFPDGSINYFNRGVTFGGDGAISVIGGSTGTNRKAALLMQMPGCETLFNFTNPKSDAAYNSRMHIEMGGFMVQMHRQGGIFAKFINPEAINIHDIRGTAQGGYWDEFLRMMNVKISSVARIYAQNNHGYAVGAPKDPNNPAAGTWSRDEVRADQRGTMINVQSTTGSIANNYDNVLSAGWYCTWNGIGSTQPSIEGTHFNGCEFGSLFGIIWHYNGNLSQYSPPLLTFTNGHMNCQRSFVNARGISQLNLTTSTFELHEELEYGDAGFDFANVGGFEISHSMIFTGAAPGQSRATVVVGPGCNNGRISHIGGAWTGARNAAGIHFQPGSHDCSMNHVEVYTAGGAIYANAGTANIFDDASIRKTGEVPASIYTANIVFVGNNQQEQHIDFPLPPGKFAARPNNAAASLANDPGFPFALYYFHDSSDASKVQIKLKRTDGYTIPAGPIRLTMTAFG